MSNLKQNLNSNLHLPEIPDVSRPLPFFGKVNIDNILPEQFEIIKSISNATNKRQLKWKSENFIITFIKSILNNNVEIIYTAKYKKFNITLKSNIKGKINIIVSQNIIKKVVVDTFIVPMLKQDLKDAKESCKILYNLYYLVRFQVDGQLLNY